MLIVRKDLLIYQKDTDSPLVAYSLTNMIYLKIKNSEDYPDKFVLHIEYSDYDIDGFYISADERSNVLSMLMGK